MKKLFMAVFGISLLAFSTNAALFFSDDFSTYADGNLVGQNGWAQQGASATLPLQITSGRLQIPGGQTVDNQDALKSFGATITQPASGTASYFFGLQLNLSSAPAANSSYFAALYDGSSFFNFRIAAKDNGAGQFLLGGRPNGQTGYPFGFGTLGLSYNTPHVLIVEADLVAGAQNDVIKLFVDPTSTDLSSQTPYATSTWNGVNGVTDPTALSGLLISQFGNATGTTTAGSDIGIVAAGDSFPEVVTAVPEPSTLALIGVGLASALLLRRRS